MSRTKYPLIKALGVEVRERYTAATYINEYGVSGLSDVKHEWTINAHDLERVLSAAPVVYGPEHCNEHDFTDWSTMTEPNEDMVYTARLLCVQPIVRDTAESLLREFVALCNGITFEPNKYSRLDLSEIYDRARKLLEGK